MTLKDKVVVIAGGTGLIGSELCKAFFGLEAIVVVASRGLSKKLDLPVLNCFLDVTSEKSVDRLIKTVLEKYGCIDVFINCSFPKTKNWMSTVEDATFESIKDELTDHLGGYFLCTKKIVMDCMKKQRAGSIINFSSIYGLVAPNFSIYTGTEMMCPPAYPMIKSGIIAMTKYFATYSAKYNIQVNCVCPGGIFNNHNKVFVKKYSALTPMCRMGKPGDIVGAVCFLADASYVTGQCVVVDGGFTSW